MGRLAELGSFGDTTTSIVTPTEKHVLLQATFSGRDFRIAFGGEAVGYYLYVYDGERCTHDYLQNSIEDAREFAFSTFGVPLESWITPDGIAEQSGPANGG